MADGVAGIGARIAKLRQHAGLSQSQLARFLHIAPASVAQYEIGKNRPSLERLVELARVLQVTTDELLGVRPLAKADRQAKAAARAASILGSVSADQQEIALQILQALRRART